MPTNSHPGRRDFLKTAAAGAAGVMGVSALKFDKIFAQSTGGWVAGMQINPAIDNKRVICCHDTNMLTATPANNDFTTTNNAVAADVVAANLDEMAMQLAQKTNADDAWSTIFRTGNSGGWAATRVAMKTNGIGGATTNRPKWAIYKKICDVLIKLGVQPQNIVLYDACDDASTYYNPHISLTDTTKIRAAQVSVRAAGMGGFKAVTLTNATGISAAADLVDGNIDILVNVAACKSHNGTGNHFNYGSCTLCMKNHFGTFTDASQKSHSDNLHVGNSATVPPPAPLALFEINKHPAVLGGNPVRQQICIVDALLSNGASGPGGGWDNRTDRLVMGTFAPIVDYLATKNILLDTTLMTKSPIQALGVTNAATILPMFLTQFGYAETDPQWTEYTPDNVPAITPGGTGGSTGTSGTTGAGGSSGHGGNSAAGGTPRTGGTTGSGGAPRTGGSSTSGSGGTTASGETTSAGGTASASSSNSTGGSTTAGTTAMSSSAGGTGGAATTAASASGGSSATGGTSAGHGTTASAAGGSAKVAALEASHGGSSGGCSVAEADRRATPWGAMLAVGAVVAGKLRRWIGG
jgi:hypothetical protein